MKRILLIFTTIILILSVCLGLQYKAQVTIKKNINSEEIYQEVIGFSKNDKIRKPVKDNILLFKNQQEWNSFFKKYLQKLPIPNVVMKGQYIVFVKVDWSGMDPTTGSKYSISNMSLIGKNLVVTVKKQNAFIEVDPIAPDYNLVM